VVCLLLIQDFLLFPYCLREEVGRRVKVHSKRAREWIKMDKAYMLIFKQLCLSLSLIPKFDYF